MYGAEEGACPFVVSRADGSESFELGEEVLDEVSGAIEVAIVFAAVGAVDLGGDDHLDIASLEDIDDAVLGVIGTIGEQGAEPADHLGQQGVGAMKIVKMALRQMKGDRVAKSIAQRVELAAQSAFAAADRLCREVPPFAPALA